MCRRADFDINTSFTAARGSGESYPRLLTQSWGALVLARSQLRSLMNYATVAVFVLFPLPPPPPPACFSSFIFVFVSTGGGGDVCVCVCVCGGGWLAGCALWCVQLCCGDDRRGLRGSAGSFQAALFTRRRSMLHLITFLSSILGCLRRFQADSPSFPASHLALFLLKAADGCWLLLEARTKYFWKCSLN